jgi:hypothetical protein
MLADTIFMRAYEDRMDLLRAVMVGASGTPYHDGLFFFDLHLPPSYPAAPPLLNYRSFGLHVNPNLYPSGAVCLSLLNTFLGRGTELWSPEASNVLHLGRRLHPGPRPQRQAILQRGGLRFPGGKAGGPPERAPVQRERLPAQPADDAPPAASAAGGIRGVRRGPLPPARAARAPSLPGVHGWLLRGHARWRGDREAATVLGGVQARSRQRGAPAC